MCIDLGLSKSTLSDIKAGRKKGISTTTAQKIAAYFGVSVGYLLGEESEKEKPAENDGLSENMQALIEFVQSVPEEKASMVLRVMKSILEDE